MGLVLGLLLALAALAAAGDKEYCTVQILVLKDYNGKPIRNAAIILHPVAKGGKQSKGGLELKADAEGKSHLEGIPYGALRVQVLAPGFQTFGQDYEISQPEVSITIRLKTPQNQYSIYGDNKPADNKPADNQPDVKPDTKPEAKPDSAKPDDKLNADQSSNPK